MSDSATHCLYPFTIGIEKAEVSSRRGIFLKGHRNATLSLSVFHLSFHLLHLSFDFVQSPTEIVVSSVDELHALAKSVASILGGGDVLGLSGPLGAGKTEFVRGMLSAYGLSGQVKSPSYLIEFEYQSSDPTVSKIRHLDCFRIEGQACDNGLEDISAASNELILVEWPEKLENFNHLLSRYIEINFAESKTNLDRKCSFISGFSDLELQSLLGA